MNIALQCAAAHPWTMAKGKTDAGYDAATAALGEAARAIGSDDFYRFLLAAVSSLIDWNCRAVCRYSMSRPPEYLIQDGADPEIIELYLRGYYRVDPYYAAFRKNENIGVMALNRDLRMHDANPYIAVFAPTAKWRDEVGILLPHGEGEAIGLFWEALDRVFRDDEIAALERVQPLVTGLNDAHAARSLDLVAAAETPPEPAIPPPGPVSPDAAVESFLAGAGLTPREREIVALSLAGRANAEIAEDLGIEVGSVKNHRGRLYRKLGIAGERELFRLFLDHLAGMADS